MKILILICCLFFVYICSSDSHHKSGRHLHHHHGRKFDKSKIKNDFKEEWKYNFKSNIIDFEYEITVKRKNLSDSNEFNEFKIKLNDFKKEVKFLLEKIEKNDETSKEEHDSVEKINENSTDIQAKKKLKGEYSFLNSADSLDIEQKPKVETFKEKELKEIIVKEPIKTFDDETFSVINLRVLSPITFMSGMKNNSVALRNIDTGNLLYRIEGDSNNMVTCLDFLSDSSFLSATDETIKLWSTSSKDFIQKFEGHSDSVSVIKVLAHNSFLSGSEDKSAQEITDTINSSLANHISRHTVNRRLIDRKLSSYVASRKPLLKPTDRIKRINFCRKILRMTDYQLKKIIFSDESNYAVINRKNRKLVRRHQNEKYNMRFIVPRLQGGGGSVGIWGCITYDGPGLCSIYDGRMDQHKYIETLENHLIPTIDLYFGDKSELIFQQDNAPCHKAKTVKSWFDENQIQVIEWPARSPDLNPIENVWAIIDKKLTKNPSTSIENLRLTLKSSFDALDVQYCQNLFNSIKKRCKLCIANKGGHIPY